MADTESNILTLLKKIAIEQKLENPDFKLAPTSSGGANYTSTLYVATITSDNEGDLHLFIKVAAMGENMRAFLKIYEVETFVYTELLPRFRRLEDQHEVPEKHRLKIPKYYGANTNYMEEIIVLENLESKGFTTHERTKSVDWRYAESTIVELAKYHALSLALKSEYPEEFKKLIEFFKFDATSIEGTEEFFDSSKKSALKVVRAENSDKLKKCFDKLDLTAFRKYYDDSKHEVLLHGDFRPSNLMHRERDDGSLEIIPVDFQMIRGGNQIIDLLNFIFTGTDKQFRGQYFEKLVDLYYSEFSSALARFSISSQEKYSRETFDEELKQKLIFGLAVAVYTLPGLTVDVEHAPQVDANMDLTSLAIQQTSAIYPDRLNGVVDDFVRWGLL